MGRQRSEYGIRAQWRALSAPTVDESLIEVLVRVPSAAIRSVSPYRLFLGRARLPGSSPGDIYVLAWWMVLVIAGVGITLTQSVWMGAFVLLVATARFLDIMAVQTGIIIVDHKRRDHYFQSIERSVLLAFNNVGQTVVCFGLVALTLTSLFPGLLVFITDCHNVNVGACNGSVPPKTVIDYVYMSAGQVLTVGSKFAPVNAGAELFHTLAVATGLLLIALSIAFFVGGITSVRSACEHATEDPSADTVT